MHTASCYICMCVHTNTCTIQQRVTQHQPRYHFPSLSSSWLTSGAVLVPDRDVHVANITYYGWNAHIGNLKLGEMDGTTCCLQVQNPWHSRLFLQRNCMLVLYLRTLGANSMLLHLFPLSASGRLCEHFCYTSQKMKSKHKHTSFPLQNSLLTHAKGVALQCIC